MKKRCLLLAALVLFLYVQAAPATWTPNQRLTWNSGDSRYPAIAVSSSGILHLVWYDNSPGNPEIFYKKSIDGGGTWTNNQRLTWTPAFSSSPSIVVDSSHRIHVVWHDYPMGESAICYTRSTDGGSTWAAMKRLTWTSDDREDPAIVSDSFGNLHVVWTDSISGNWEIYHRKSTDGGNNWAAARRLTWTSGDCFEPTAAAGPSGHVHVVWWNDQAGNPEVYHKRSTDGGGTWAAPQRLSWSSGGTYYPDIAVDSSGHPHVVWHDYTPGFPDIFHRMSADAGASWTTRQRLSWTSSYSMDPAIAAGASGSLHVVWYDTTPGNNEIYYVRSTNGGATWEAAQRLTSTSGDSEEPDIVVDSSGYLHVVWDDGTSGNQEIYYKRGN